MTETAPEDDRRRASTEPGVEGEGDQFEASSHAHAEAADRPADAARETEVDEDRNS